MIGMIPFYANYGYEPTIIHEALVPKQTAQEAVRAVERLKNLYKQLARDIVFTLVQTVRHYDKRRLEASSLKKGDRVYLLQCNIRIKRPSNKLDHTKLGPFLVLEKTSLVNYRLALLEGSRIHLTFYVSLLERAPPGMKLQTTLDVQEEKEYKIEKILDHRRVSGKTQYLVK